MASLADMMKQETLAESPNPVRGVGGGLADFIPARVQGQDGSQQGLAQLSEGEFVFPADVVSMLGDGSSEAGARILHGLMNKIRGLKQGEGGEKQAKSILDLLGT